MQLRARMPGPIGLYKARSKTSFIPGPTGFDELLRDLFEDQDRKDIKPDAEQKAYKLLSAAWKRWHRWYKKGDCMAACFLVANQFRYRGRWPNRYAPVKMFKHDKKWCKGNERDEAIARRNGGFRDVIISKHILVYQGPLRGFHPANTESFSLKPGMCLFKSILYT